MTRLTEHVDRREIGGERRSEGRRPGLEQGVGHQQEALGAPLVVAQLGCEIDDLSGEGESFGRGARRPQHVVARQQAHGKGGGITCLPGQPECLLAEGSRSRPILRDRVAQLSPWPRSIAPRWTRSSVTARRASSRMVTMSWRGMENRAPRRCVPKATAARCEPSAHRCAWDRAWANSCFAASGSPARPRASASATRRSVQVASETAAPASVRRASDPSEMSSSFRERRRVALGGGSRERPPDCTFRTVERHGRHEMASQLDRSGAPLPLVLAHQRHRDLLVQGDPPGRGELVVERLAKQIVDESDPQVMVGVDDPDGGGVVDGPGDHVRLDVEDDGEHVGSELVSGDCGRLEHGSGRRITTATRRVMASRTASGTAVVSSPVARR